MALKKSDLYSSIWASCDELRGGMDASQYKDYVLFMLFIKYISDKYGTSDAFAPAVVIPPGASFGDMVALKGKPDIGDKIDTQVIQPLARTDFPDFNDPNKLGEGQAMVDRLTNLIGIFQKPELDFSQNRADHDDILGDAYEYLMRHFAQESGKSKGQFYTPAEVSRVIAQVIGISPRLPGFSGEWEVRNLGEVVDTDPENLSADTTTEFAFNYIALEDVDRGVLTGHSQRVVGSARPARVVVCAVATFWCPRYARISSRTCSSEGGRRQLGLFDRVLCSPVSGPGDRPCVCFNSLFGRNITRQIDALLTGSNYPAINGGDVMALTIPVPPFDEQLAIAAVLSDMDAELEALEARREKTRALKQAMMQELLTGRTRLV